MTPRRGRPVRKIVEEEKKVQIPPIEVHRAPGQEIPEEKTIYGAVISDDVAKAIRSSAA